MATPPTTEQVMEVLGSVIDPELGADIVTLGMVPRADVAADGIVTVEVKLTIKGCPLRADIKREIEGRLTLHPGVTAVSIVWGEMDADERSAVMTKARWNARQNAPDTEVPASCRVLAIASGKGGVGKSSVTVNLAAALAATGFTVGVLDADIWGFSVPRLLGISDRMEAQSARRRTEATDHPERAGRRRRPVEGRVDGLPRRRGDRADVARPHAHQGGRAVPARRALGGARLPPDRHAARDRRRPDGARPDAPAHRPHRRHHARARRTEGGPAGRRHGQAQLPAGARRDREHEHVHL